MRKDATLSYYTSERNVKSCCIHAAKNNHSELSEVSHSVTLQQPRSTFLAKNLSNYSSSGKTPYFRLASLKILALIYYLLVKFCVNVFQLKIPDKFYKTFFFSLYLQVHGDKRKPARDYH